MIEINQLVVLKKDPNNIDTRKSYQFVCEKDDFIFYIEGSFRIGEEEYFKRIIKQIIVSIEEINKGDEKTIIQYYQCICVS